MNGGCRSSSLPLIRAEVDLDAIAANIRQLRRITRPEARLMAVVKANGYGHGAVEVAREAMQNGAESLGVARIDEGMVLRNAGISAPILIFSYTPPSEAESLLALDLTATVSSYATARALSEAATGLGKTVRIHLKVDTGMGRLGLLAHCGESSLPGLEAAGAADEVEAIFRLPGLVIEGIFTHFATADSADKSYARQQLAIFTGFLETLRLRGITFAVRHAANSAAIIDLPETHLDLVRAGVALYGLRPSDEVHLERIDLKPAMSIKARIIHLKRVPAGFPLSYGITYRTDRPTIIATVSAGYADGLNRLLSSRGSMLVRGRRAPIVGRVCMDHCMLDTGAIPEAGLEDEAVILGRQGAEEINADEIATLLSTINYEVVCAVGARVPRVYVRSSETGTFPSSSSCACSVPETMKSRSGF